MSDMSWFEKMQRMPWQRKSVTIKMYKQFK